MKRLLDSVIAWLRNLRHRPTLLTILANNSSTLSSTLTSLVSVPLALHYLTNKEFGLWAFTSQSIGYFLLLDLGVSTAVSRLLAEPLAHGNRPAANQWLTLCAVVMATQGAIIGLTGWLLVDHILVWFAIPPELMSQARTLWLWMFALAVAQYLIRIIGGILYAQNRFYWNNFGNTIAFWVGLAAFVWFLKHGDGILSYAYSSAVQTFCAAWIPWLGVRLGPARFHLDFRNITLGSLRRLYGFSGALSVGQIANLLMVSGQTLIVTKMLGLDAAAGYNVSSKVILTARGVLWQLFESFLPGWQRLYLKGQIDELLEQWRVRFDLVTSTSLVICIVYVAVNRWFVDLWARPELYQGISLDVSASFFTLSTIITAGFAFPQLFAMKVWARSILFLLGAIISIGIGIILIPHLGAASVFWAGTAGYFCTLVWYSIYQFGKLIPHQKRKPTESSFKSIRFLAVFIIFTSLEIVSQFFSDRIQLIIESLAVAGSLTLFLADWKSSLLELFLGKRGSSNSNTQAHETQK